MDKKITDYKPLQRNPNKGTQRGSGILDQSVRELGAGRSLLVDKNGVILAGNHAQEAFVNAGFENVIEVETDGNSVVVVKRTDMEANSTAGKKMAIMDNRTSEQGLAWDAVVLEELMQEIQADDGELDQALEKLAKDAGVELHKDMMEAPEPELDKAEQLREKWGVELGQLWQLGEHRLICGDCRDETITKRLMEDRLADILFTDPPYGVAYKGKTKDALEILDDDIDEDTLREYTKEWFDVCEKYTRDGAYWLATVPAGPLHEVFLVDWKNRGILRQVMVWVKDSMVLGHSEYHYKHEPILFGWKRGDRIKSEDRTKTTVWEFDRPKASREHPTMKPVEMWVYGIEQHTNKGDLSFEPFSGSGTNLLACEMTKRICFAIEKYPKYVAVAIERWHQMTGKEPVLLNDV